MDELKTKFMDLLHKQVREKIKAYGTIRKFSDKIPIMRFIKFYELQFEF